MSVFRTREEQIQKNKEDIEALKRGGGGSSEWEKRVSEVLDYNTTDEQVEIGTDLEVDGKILINESNDFENSYGDKLTLVPDPVNSDLGKYLKVGSTGLTWATAGGGGGALYRHYVMFENMDTADQFFVILYSSSPTAYTWTSIKNLLNDLFYIGYDGVNFNVCGITAFSYEEISQIEIYSTEEHIIEYDQEGELWELYDWVSQI